MGEAEKLWQEAYNFQYKSNDKAKAIEIYNLIINMYPDDICCKYACDQMKILNVEPTCLDIKPSITPVETYYSFNEDQGTEYSNKIIVCDKCGWESLGKDFTKIEGFDFCRSCIRKYTMEEIDNTVLLLKQKNEDNKNSAEQKIQEYYMLLGLTCTASEQEVIEKYNNLKSKWVLKNFISDPEMYKNAAQVNNDLDEAFSAICSHYAALDNDTKQISDISHKSLYLSDETLKEYVLSCLEPDETDYSYKFCILDSSTASKVFLGIASVLMIKNFCLVKTNKRIVLIALSKLNEVKNTVSYNLNDISEFSCKKGLLLNYSIKLRSKSGDKYEFKASNIGHGDLEPFIRFSI